MDRKWWGIWYLVLARIIWSWQCCRLFVGNIANGIASKFFFAFLTELGNFKQKFFWRQCHSQYCQTKVCSIVKSRWFGPIIHYHKVNLLFYLFSGSATSFIQKMLVVLPKETATMKADWKISLKKSNKINKRIRMNFVFFRFKNKQNKNNVTFTVQNTCQHNCCC